MYLLTFKRLIEVAGESYWEVVGEMYTTRKSVVEKAKALYESVDGQRCDVKEPAPIRGLNLTVVYIDEAML